MVEVVILGVNPADKRIALGLKQALGDPWEEAMKKYTAGAVAEGKVTSLTKFGAFVDLGDNIEGMIHIGDISREKRLNHPNEVLKVGQKVKAQVLEADKERRRHSPGDQATGADQHRRIYRRAQSRRFRLRTPRRRVRTEGESRTGRGSFRLDARSPSEQPAKTAASRVPKPTFGSLTAMLSQRWKSGGGGDAAAAEAPKRRSDPQFQDLKHRRRAKTNRAGTG